MVRKVSWEERKEGFGLGRGTWVVGLLGCWVVGELTCGCG